MLADTSDVAVIGGGIAGCATAALLAEAGAAVTLYEREAIGAGASGRNSGIVQHPLDPALVALYKDSLALYQGLGHGFELPAEPAGVMIVSDEGAVLATAHEAAARRFPELAPEWLEGEALRTAEPAMGPGLYAYRVAAGRPIGPTAATRAWAERACAAGARIVLGEPARVARRDERVAGVRVGGDGTRGRRRRRRRAARRRRGRGGRRAVDAGGDRRRRRTGSRCGPTGASWRRCACAGRRDTRSSRPGSRR